MFPVCPRRDTERGQGAFLPAGRQVAKWPHLFPRPRRAGIPYTKFEKIVLGAFSEVGTPVPIPNTEVKRGSSDDTLQWGK